MTKPAFYAVNGITLYRLLAAPFLVYLIYTKQVDIFKWFVGVSFFTDVIDGLLARKYKVISVMGARLDSIADDLTVLASFIGVYVFFPGFVNAHVIELAAMLALYIVQLIISLVKYRKTTSFHTYSAKIAAVFQGVFLITAFFLPQPHIVLYYLAIVSTFITLAEETIMAILLPRWQADVRGIYQVLKNREKYL